MLFRRWRKIRYARQRDSYSAIVMAGLGPAIHVLLRDCIVEIVPIRIISDYQSDLPCSGPMFDVMFALNCALNTLKFLEIDQSLKLITFGKTFDESGSVLKNSTDEVICYADVKNAVRTICQKINKPACHSTIVQRRGWPGQARP
jgi:hypothetical protein